MNMREVCDINSTSGILGSLGALLVVLDRYALFSDSGAVGVVGSGQVIHLVDVRCGSLKSIGRRVLDSIGWVGEGEFHVTFKLSASVCDELIEIRLDGDVLYISSNLENFATDWNFSGFLSNLSFAVRECHHICLADELEVVSPEQESFLLREFNGSGEYGVNGNGRLEAAFEERAALEPNATAVVCGDRVFTYEEIDARANDLKNLIGCIDREGGVAIFIDRNELFIISVLAVLKAGRSYVPIDIVTPLNRFQRIVDASQVSCVISDESVIDLDIDRSVLLYRNGDIRCNFRTDQMVSSSIVKSDIAYTIFTSGSTGEPKGVVLRHDTVLRTIQWVIDYFPLSHSDYFLQVASFAFDLSVFDIFASLSIGATLHIATRSQLACPRTIAGLLYERATVWNSAPASALAIVSEFRDVVCQRPVNLMLSGDVVSPSLVSCFLDTFKSSIMLSLGGATEASIWSNYYRVDERDRYSRRIPYGQPMDHARYYILDSKRRLVPFGATGELYIAGECLAVGYLCDAETASRFIDDPFVASGGKMYRTGDLVRFNSSGLIDILGRVDHQVKIRGNRVELHEISVVAERLVGVNSAICLAVGGDNHKSLILFYTGDENAKIKDHLSNEFSGYMIPSRVLRISSMPTTSNGKIDRKRLIKYYESYIGSTFNGGVKGDVDEGLDLLMRSLTQLVGFPVTDLTTSFSVLDIDSLSRIRLVQMMNDGGFSVNVGDLNEGKIENIKIKPLQILESKGSSKRFGLANSPNHRWYFKRTVDLDSWVYTKGYVFEGLPLKFELVQSILYDVVMRYDALRYTYRKNSNGDWVFIVGDASEFNILEFVRVNRCHDRGVIESVQRKISLRDQAFCFVLVVDDVGAQELVLCFHHLVIDGISMEILEREISRSVAAAHKVDFYAARSCSQPELGSFWERHDQWLRSSVGATNAHFWEYLNQIDIDSFWFGRDKALNTMRSQKEQAVTLDFDLLENNARAFGVTKPAVILFGLSQAVQATFGIESVLYEIVCHGREESIFGPKICSAVGFFNQFVPVYVDASRFSCDESYLGVVNDRLTSTLNHSMSFAIFDDVYLDRAEIAVNYIALGAFESRLPNVRQYTYPEPCGGDRERVHAISLQVVEREDGVCLTAYYSENVFHVSQVNSLLFVIKCEIETMLNVYV